jgi:hypothetical protein
MVSETPGHAPYPASHPPPVLVVAELQRPQVVATPSAPDAPSTVHASRTQTLR